MMRKFVVLAKQTEDNYLIYDYTKCCVHKINTDIKLEDNSLISIKEELLDSELEYLNSLNMTIHGQVNLSDLFIKLLRLNELKEINPNISYSTELRRFDDDIIYNFVYRNNKWGLFRKNIIYNYEHIKTVDNNFNILSLNEYMDIKYRVEKLMSDYKLEYSEFYHLIINNDFLKGFLIKNCMYKIIECLFKDFVFSGEKIYMHENINSIDFALNYEKVEIKEKFYNHLSDIQKFRINDNSRIELKN